MNSKTISLKPLSLETAGVPSSRTLTAGAGLTGGGDLSADRQFDVGAGTGIVVNADDVQLDLASSRNADHTAIDMVAGAGLSGGGDISASRTFDIGTVSATRIVVNANDIDLATTGVTPGNYTAANISVDAYGRVTSASSGGAGTGDVVGPGSATDEAIARFDGVTGKLIQDSVVLISDVGDMSGIGDITLSGTVDGRDVATDGTVQDNHIADATIHFTEASIDHVNIQNVGTNTHAQIDTHIADSTIHFTEASIDHVNIQNVGTNTHAQIDLHIADSTIHFTEASIDHTAIQNVGTNTHAQIDTHIADTNIHYADAPADGNNYARNNNNWTTALATTAVAGFAEIATQAEVDAGTDTIRYVTPDTLNNTTLFDGRYVDFVSAETITGVKTFQPFASGVLGQNDAVFGDLADYGLIALGDSTIGRTAFNALSLDLDGSMLFFNEALPATSNIEFAFADGTNDIRFALAVPGAGNATYSPRSMLIAGPAVLDDEIVTVGYWRTNNNIFDNIDCDTSANGADLGVQNDLEVEGQIFVDLIQESTPAAGVTLQADDGGAGGGSGGDGQMVWDGNQIALFPSDITFGEGYLIGWGATGDPTTPFANRINLNSASGFSFLFSNADFPQWIIGSTTSTSSVFIDGNGNKDIRFNTLDTGFDQDNVVYFGYGGINLQDQAGDAIFIQSAATVAGTYTITLPDTDGDAGQVLVNQDGAATLDWEDPAINYVMPLWAEENGPLAAGATEWAFGNGANTPIAQGVPLYVPAGLSAEIVAMGLAFPSGTATVQLVINGVAQGATANVTHTGPGGTTNTLGAPVPVVNGDVLNFQTQTVTVATAAPAQVIAYIRIFSP